jgi:alpha-L-rhamnosidase
VYGDQKLGDVLTSIKVVPDFQYTKSQPDTNLLFVHRKLPDGDAYFVDNRNDRDETLDAIFRVKGKAAELWHADTGKTEPASYTTADGRTTVPLHLEPWGTVFVVFRQTAKSASRTLPKMVDNPIATVEGPWDLNFQADRGAPAKISLDKLSSWSDNSDEGIKYFSGTGTYTKTMQAPADWFKHGAHLSIDLGEVKNLAEVAVNGKALGIVWKKPYRVDVTNVLKPGANTVEIKVTNPWVNRIIGDRQPNAAKAYTFTSPKFYKADAKLVPSGLLGPVQIIRSTTADEKK